MPKKISYKEYQATIETRTGPAGKEERTLFGIIPYLSRSENMGGFFEVIAPSAFAHTINDGADVKCLIDHDSSKIVARVKNDTLKLESKIDGLHFEVMLNKTGYANDLLENVRTGNISSMSFGFITLIDDWDYTTEPAIRTLKDVKLIEVSFVVFPAYPETQAQSRSQLFSDSGLDELESLIIRSQNPRYEVTDADCSAIEKNITALRSMQRKEEKKIPEPAPAIPETYYADLAKQITR